MGAKHHVEFPQQFEQLVNLTSCYVLVQSTDDYCGVCVEMLDVSGGSPNLNFKGPIQIMILLKTVGCSAGGLIITWAQYPCHKEMQLCITAPYLF